MSSVADPTRSDQPVSKSADVKTTGTNSGSESGSENGAKPVRQQLEKTNITKPIPGADASPNLPTNDAGPEHEQVASNNPNVDAPTSEAPAKAPKKKRSFDDLTADEQREGRGSVAEASEGHTRKRSRDVKSGEFSRANGVRMSPEAFIQEEQEEEQKLSHKLDENGEGDGGAASAGVEKKDLEAPETMDSAQNEMEDEELPNVDRTSHTKPAASTHDAEAAGRRPPSAMRKRNAAELTPSSPEKGDTGTIRKPSKSPVPEGKRSRLSGEDDEQRRGSPSPSRSPRKRSREVLKEEEEREQKIAATDDTVKRKSMEDERPNLAPPAQGATKAIDASTAVELRQSTSPAKIPASSGFSNISTTSPFKTASGGSSWLAGASEIPKPSSLFASSTKSTATRSLSPSKSSFSGLAAENTSTSGSSFGNLTNTTTTSGLGSSKVFGGGFASGFGASSAGKISSFAAPLGDIGAKKDPKKTAFGAPATQDDQEREDDENEDEEDGDAGEDDTAASEVASTEKPQPIEPNTGEEDEIPLYVSRGKLYHFQPEKKAWAERGVGPIKLNAKNPALYGEDAEKKKPEARLIMRAAATHKVILNTKIFKEMKLGDQHGNKPSGRILFFSAAFAGPLVPVQLKMPKEQDVLGLYNAVKKFQDGL